MSKIKKTTIKVTDNAGAIHEFGQDRIRFWHDGDICRIYVAGVDNQSSETLGSFTRPIAVVVKKG